MLKKCLPVARVIDWNSMIDGHTSRTHFYVSMQQSGLICAVNPLSNDALEVQGQRVRTQPDSFWSYYPGDVGILCKVWIAGIRSFLLSVEEEKTQWCFISMCRMWLLADWWILFFPSSSSILESNQLESSSIENHTREQRLYDSSKFWLLETGFLFENKTTHWFLLWLTRDGSFLHA